MADKENRLPTNTTGRYYVDDNCIDCDICRQDAPLFFNRDDDIGFSVVIRQPVTVEEIELAEAAILGCPTEAIGNDG